MKKSTSFFIFFMFLIILATILGITIYELRPVFKNLFNGTGSLQKAIDDYMDDIGVFRAIILMVLQFATVMLTILPSEPVQIVAGLSYGYLYGTIICLVGVLIANTTIYLMFKKIGDQVTKFYPNFENWEKKYLLKHNRWGRILNIVFLYLMPFIPYGVIAYFASRSKLKFIPFILVTTFGVIPSILTSTLLTGSVLSGNKYLTMAIIIFVVIASTIAIILKKVLNKDQVVN